MTLSNIASGTVLGKDMTDDLLGAYEKGFKRMNDFLRKDQTLTKLVSSRHKPNES